MTHPPGMTPNDIAALATCIAEEEIGGPPPRCTGHTADRYTAAYNAVVKAAAALSAQGLEAATVERAKDAAKRAVQLYADSYAQMGRVSKGDGRVDCRSVEVDLRRNVVESVTRAIALATEPHQHGGSDD